MPKILALTLTRNEDWVLGLSLRVSLTYCDGVIITDHGSTDRTEAILQEVRAEFPDKTIDVRRIEPDDIGNWPEMDMRQEMLERGRANGGTHFVIVDADEVPTGNLLPYLRGYALAPNSQQIVCMPMISPYHQPGVFRYDGNWGQSNMIPWSFADHPELSWAPRDGYQHHARSPRSAQNIGLMFSGYGAGGLFHLQYVNKRRLQAKAVWYKLMETIRYPGRMSPEALNHMYNWTLVEKGELELHEVPEDWWAPYKERGWLKHFTHDAPPWQLEDARALWAKHGPEKFAGIDLCGLNL